MRFILTIFALLAAGAASADDETLASPEGCYMLEQLSVHHQYLLDKCSGRVWHLEIVQDAPEKTARVLRPVSFMTDSTYRGEQVLTPQPVPTPVPDR